MTDYHLFFANANDEFEIDADMPFEAFEDMELRLIDTFDGLIEKGGDEKTFAHNLLTLLRRVVLNYDMTDESISN